MLKRILNHAWPRPLQRVLVMVGLALVSVGMFLITLTRVGNFMALLLLVADLAVGQSLVTPSLSSLLSRATPVEHQGTVFGLYQSGMALARTIGPLTAGVLFDRSENMPYWVGGSLMILAFLGALSPLRRPLKRVTVPV